VGQQQQPPYGHARPLTHQSSAGNLGGGYTSASQAAVSSAVSAALGGSGNSLVPASASSYYPSSATAPASTARARSNTTNLQTDPVPAALARLQHMNQDVIAGRNALTPVLNRDDAMREWERRQAGKPSAAQPYPQLEFLQQQAELATQAGTTNWARYQPPVPPLSKLGLGAGAQHAYHPPGPSGLGEERDEASVRRDAVMSNVRSAAAAGSGGRGVDGGGYGASAASSVISSPAQAYSSGGTTSGNRYAATYAQAPPPSSQQGQQSFDAGSGPPSLFVPMQPEQYQSYNGPPSATTRVAPPPQTVPPSFYGPGAVATGPPPPGRNPFSTSGDPGSKDPVRRGTNGLDAWPR
jgi:dual specificity protein kinase YAK1